MERRLRCSSLAGGWRGVQARPPSPRPPQPRSIWRNRSVPERPTLIGEESGPARSAADPDRRGAMPSLSVSSSLSISQLSLLFLSFFLAAWNGGGVDVRQGKGRRHARSLLSSSTVKNRGRRGGIQGRTCGISLCGGAERPPRTRRKRKRREKEWLGYMQRLLRTNQRCMMNQVAENHRPAANGIPPEENKELSHARMETEHIYLDLPSIRWKHYIDSRNIAMKSIA